MTKNSLFALSYHFCPSNCQIVLLPVFAFIRLELMKFQYPIFLYSNIQWFLTYKNSNFMFQPNVFTHPSIAYQGRCSSSVWFLFFYFLSYLSHSLLPAFYFIMSLLTDHPFETFMILLRWVTFSGFYILLLQHFLRCIFNLSGYMFISVTCTCWQVMLLICLCICLVY